MVGKKHVITVVNPIEAYMSQELSKLVTPCVSFESVYYKQGIFKKERSTYQKSMISKPRKGQCFVWAGLVERILSYCIENNIDVEVDDQSKEEIIMYEPELKGIKFREDQMRLINAFLDNPRGILSAFTGSGKTVLGFGCISAFEDFKTLWLCHTVDLVNQAYDEAIKFGFKSVGRVGGGHAEYDKNITIATRQSFMKLADEYGHIYDMVVCDEVHHVGKKESEYQYVLSRVLAPVRLGLTATMKDDLEATFVCEGLIGPVRQALTINQGQELGILARPKIKIHKLKKDHSIANLRTYAEVYSAAVVNNLSRNILIAQIAKDHAEKGETTLIMINQIEQGTNIMKQLEAIGVPCAFVRGATEGDRRTQIKNDLNNGKIHTVICSSVWVEGVNIPSLKVVIMADGGKATVGVLQKVGRGLRKTSDKDEVYLHDFFDPSHRFLLDHFGERIILYLDNNWI